MGKRGMWVVIASVAVGMFAVYFPMAHMVWGFDGKFNGVWNGGAGFVDSLQRRGVRDAVA